MPGSDESRPRSSGKGCGIQAALGFLILIGLPLLFILSFGNAPCPDGPCNPDGAANLRVAALTIAVVALLIGGVVWWLVDRRRPHGSHRRSGELPARLLLVVAGAFLLYLIVG